MSVNILMLYVDTIPVVLAATALFSLGHNYKRSRRNADKLSIFLQSIACIILIIAQTGWQYSFYILDDLDDIKGTEWQNYAWQAFNLITMIIFNLGFIRNKNYKQDTATNSH